MHPPQFDYYRANSVDEALALAAQHDGAKFLAGGHSLIPVMKLRLADPGVLIDIGRIPDLNGITSDNGHFRIGALTTHATVAAYNDSQMPAALPEAAGKIGDPQVRNRGTVGGNVAHADPASDLPTVFTALNATFHVAGPNGTRTIAAQNFFTDLFETAMNENELLVAIDVPAEARETGSAYVKLFNPASRYAVVGVAASVTASMTGDCSACTVAVGGLTVKATVAHSVGSSLVGKKLNHENIAAAAQAVLNDLGDDLIGDMHASADYRRAIAPALVERALLEAADRAGLTSKLGKAAKGLADDIKGSLGLGD
jgi:carbon-monoxide dehydrogenase medium subunit